MKIENSGRIVQIKGDNFFAGLTGKLLVQQEEWGVFFEKSSVNPEGAYCWLKILTH